MESDDERDDDTTWATRYEVPREQSNDAALKFVFAKGLPQAVNIPANAFDGLGRVAASRVERVLNQLQESYGDRLPALLALSHLRSKAKCNTLPGESVACPKPIHT